MKKAYKAYTSNTLLANASLDSIRAWNEVFYESNFSKYLPANKNARILDIGCGHGGLLLWLSKAGYTNLTGVDFSEEQFMHAKQCGIGSIHNEGALEFLQQQEEGFDIVFCVDVLEHLETAYLLDLAEQIHHSLNDGGHVILQVPNGLAPFNPIRYGDITHHRSFTVGSIEQLFIGAGFNKEQIRCIDVAPHIHGPTSLIRNILWRFFVHPIIGIIFLLCFGDRLRNIYSANLITIVDKGQGW